MSNDSVHIPLRRRDGTVRAYVVVDATDAEWANQWRWHLNAGYASRTDYSTGTKLVVRLHREILALPRVSDGREGDHEDRDKLNCRRSNLRPATHQNNLQNQTPQQNRTSTHRGVYWSKQAQKWAAQVKVDGKPRYLGVFTDEAAAAKVASDERARLMPFSADCGTRYVAEDLAQPPTSPEATGHA